MKKRSTTLLALLLSIIMLAFVGCTQQQAPQEADKQEAPVPAIKNVILATTTSTQDSGLLDVLKPKFEKQTGYNLQIIAVGTGAALQMGEKGEADVLLTHAPKSEQPLVDSGVAINYSQIMHNDFIIVGPENDPASIKNTSNTAEALKMIADNNAIFISRGDESGTHKKEQDLWQEAQIEPKGQDWYHESGTGMGATLNISSEKQGYTLTDRATYLAQRDNAELAILLQDDKSLVNIYHVMNVNPEKFDKVNDEGGKAFVDFMMAEETQDLIAKFGVEQYGEPLFFADANK